MPLDPKASVGSNISEFHKGPTYASTKKKFGTKRANAQAIAVAESVKRRAKRGSTGAKEAPKHKKFDQLS